MKQIIYLTGTATKHRSKRQSKNKRKGFPNGLTKQVDNAFVVSSKEPDGVFEEEHEGCVDDSISQLVGIDLREKQSARKFMLKPFCSLQVKKTQELPICNA